MNTDKHGSVFIGGFILCSFTQTKFEMIGSHHRSHEVAGLPACPLQPLVRLRYSATARYHFRSSTAARRPSRTADADSEKGAFMLINGTDILRTADFPACSTRMPGLIPILLINQSKKRW